VQYPVHNLNGEVVKNIEISDTVFAVPFNEALVHQAVTRQQANARQGTAATKARGEVAGSGKKMYRQKHTGLARAGDRRSPTRRGGGIAFGPQPRDYRKEMPKKMRQLALRCTLSAKARDREMMVLEELKLEEPKTKLMAGVLVALGVNTAALVVTSQPEVNVILSARNLTGVKTLPANLLNVVDILNYKKLLITETSIRKIEELWGGSNASL
jgi:large subunit ribosomal protein L4